MRIMVVVYLKFEEVESLLEEVDVPELVQEHQGFNDCSIRHILFELILNYIPNF